MSSLLAGILRQHREALARAVARELGAALDDAAARAQADSLLTALARSAADPVRLIDTVHDAALRWRVKRVPVKVIRRALLALIAPSGQAATELDLDAIVRARLGEGGSASADSRDAGTAERLQYEATQKEKFTALLTVSHTVVNTLDLNTIFTTIVRQVRLVVQADECTVFLLDQADQLLKPVVCDVEKYHDEMMSVRLRIGEGITGYVAMTGRGEIIQDVESDPRAFSIPGTPAEKASMMSVPLHSRDRVAGVITMTRQGERCFADEDLELATLFAGQCSAAISNARLFDEMKHAYEELRQTQTQLVQSAKLNALGEMAGGVAHDFNNILAAILGRTQLLIQKIEDPAVRRQLQVIEQAALDGAHTVRRVQEFTRVRHDESFETLDVNQVVMGVVELTRTAWEAGAKRRGVAIDVEVELRASRSIAGNASELREVFTNLVLNAVDAMPWGGRLSITTESDERDVRVTFEDNGVGMDQETRERVFDPFFTTKRVKGTGLGLSVAYGIVSRHRGSIDVQSEVDVGTSFTLRFPVGERQVGAAVALPGGPPPRLRALVVDDEEPVLAVMADLLNALGQDVMIAQGGAAGLEAFEHETFDVVFTDLGMPEVNGWDLALGVKSRRPATPVVLVTGWGFQLEGGAAEAHGVDFVLPKPFSLEEVERVLRQVGERILSARAA
ncbi:MAG TPA: ATP-binding protein [Candidatus Udaeobacter sp.]|nr:ATP-binding protein [Candidatus Udaeobacter sp.]